MAARCEHGNEHLVAKNLMRFID